MPPPAPWVKISAGGGSSLAFEEEGKRWHVISLPSKGIENVGEAWLWSDFADSCRPPFKPPRVVCEGAFEGFEEGLLVVALEGCLRFGGIMKNSRSLDGAIQEL
jgi:hypothetical protein